MRSLQNRTWAVALMSWSLMTGCRASFDDTGGDVGDTTDSDGMGSATNGSGTQSDSGSGSASGSGTDSNGDDDDTGGDICPGATHSCVPEPVAGWAGPLAVYTGASGGLPPGCGGGYPTLEHQLDGDLNPGSASCGCDCGPATGVDCKAVTMDYYGNNSCSGTALSTNVGGPLEPNQCEIIGMAPFSGTWVEISNGGIDAPGSCQPQLTEQIPTPSWDAAISSCGGAELMGGCDASEVCAPRLPTEFADLCIASSGDVACPDGPYTVRSVWYDEFEDDRACVGCSCSSPTGICEGGVELRDGGCNSQLLETVPTGGCGSGSIDNTYLAVEYKPDDGSCTATTATVDGAVVGVGAVTYCCLE